MFFFCKQSLLAFGLSSKSTYLLTPPSSQHLLLQETTTSQASPLQVRGQNRSSRVCDESPRKPRVNGRWFILYGRDYRYRPLLFTPLPLTYVYPRKNHLHYFHPGENWPTKNAATIAPGTGSASNIDAELPCQTSLFSLIVPERSRRLHRQVEGVSKPNSTTWFTFFIVSFPYFRFFCSCLFVFFACVSFFCIVSVILRDSAYTHSTFS